MAKQRNETDKVTTAGGMVAPEELVTFGVRHMKGKEYVAVRISIIGNEAKIETIDVKRPYIQHAYAKAGDALIEHGITQAGKVR